MYVSAPPTVLCQGDIFTGLQLVDAAAPAAPARAYNVVVLSHACEIAKPSNSVVLVCGIRPLEGVDVGNQGHIRKNRVRNAMYLEPVGSLKESFVDFRFVFRVAKAFLEEAIRRGLRVASMNEEAQLALATFFYRFLVRDIPGKG